MSEGSLARAMDEGGLMRVMGEDGLVRPAKCVEPIGHRVVVHFPDHRRVHLLPPRIGTNAALTNDCLRLQSSGHISYREVVEQLKVSNHNFRMEC